MIQRYILSGRPVVETPHLVSYQAEGDVVLYKDHLFEMAKLQSENKKLKNALEKADSILHMGHTVREREAHDAIHEAI